MSAGFCGKRVGFEEIFGSSSPTSLSSAKRSRCSALGSPVRSPDFATGSDEERMRRTFLSPDPPRLMETVLTNADKVGSTSNSSSFDGDNWAESFVNEMIKATDVDDARARVANILAAFEECVSTQLRVSEEIEYVSLKEYLNGLSIDNQFLKRAIAVQHERNLEQEEKMSEVQQIKHLLNQHEEQIQTLQLNNYTLKLHLQRAQDSSFISGHFQPSVQ